MPRPNNSTHSGRNAQHSAEVTIIGGHISPIEPLVPLVKIDETIFNAICPVLMEDFVHGSGKPFRISVRQSLFMVQKDPSVVVFVVQRLEIFRVVRQEDSIRFTTLFDQVGITRPFTEPVFRLFNPVSALAENAFENSAEMFIKQNLRGCHWTVSSGLSDDSRSRSNAVSFSASSSRIWSMCS